MMSPDNIDKSIWRDILSRKKAFFCGNTLCISKKNNAFPAQKSRQRPQSMLVGDITVKQLNDCLIVMLAV